MGLSLFKIFCHNFNLDEKPQGFNLKKNSFIKNLNKNTNY